MADSIRIQFPLDHLTTHQYEHAELQFDALLPFDQDGEAKRVRYEWMTLRSPLTRAGFKVKAYGPERRVAGYLVDINVPACTIGNNLLLVNGVPRAAEIALLLLQHWLLSKGCRRLGVFSLKLENARVVSVTLTYAFLLSSLETAQAARRDFATHADGVLNQRYLSRPRSGHKPVFWIGTENANTYIRQREFEIATYVKDGTGADAFVSFPSPEVEQLVRAEAEKCLRVEIKLYGAWLRDNGRDTVNTWRILSDQVDPYEIGLKMIRKTLCLDDDLRERRPKETDIAKLFAEDQNVLRWHLDGHNPRQHPRLLEHKSADARNRVFSEIKARIYDRCRVDISLPWAVQSTAYSRRLAELLQFANRYSPPPHLMDHVYSPKSVARVLPLLKQKVQAITHRGISNVYISPEMLEDEAIEDYPEKNDDGG